MTNSYCQPNESVFWFPVSPGTVELPALPNEVADSPVPTNGAEIPPNFNIEDPDLCELFNDILPSNVDPVYPLTVTVGTVIPPYFEIVVYDFRVRTYLTLTKYNYDLTPVTMLDLAVRIPFNIYQYPISSTVTIRLAVVTGETELLDYTIAVLVLKSILTVTSSVSADASILFHFDGEEGTKDYINYGTLQSAIIDSAGEPVILNTVGKFSSSSLYSYGTPSYVSVQHSSLSLTTVGTPITFSGWVYFDPAISNREHYIMSLDPGTNGNRNGIAVNLSSTSSNYVSIYSNGSPYNILELGDDPTGEKFLGKWIYWAFQKRADTNLWVLHFSTYSTSQFGMGSNWFGRDKYYFGGYVDITYNSLFGAMDEVAIHTGINLHPMTGPLTVSDFPSAPYLPASGYNVFQLTTKLAISAEYISISSIFEVVVSIRTTFSKFTPAAAAIVTVVDYTGTGAARTLTTPDVAPSFIWLKNLQSTVSGVSPCFLDLLRGNNIHTAFGIGNSFYSGSGLISTFGYRSVSTSSSNALVNQNGIAYRLVAFGNTNDQYTETSGNIQVNIARNEDFGFSICSWTGAGSGTTVSIPHGLGIAPEFIIHKSNNTSRVAWGGTLIGTDKLLNNEEGGNPSTWSNISHNSQYVTASNSAANTYMNSIYGNVMYCFKSMPGKTKFGYYDGLSLFQKNINVGFPPSLVIIRQWTNVTSATTSVAYSSEVNKSWRPFSDTTSDTTFTTDITTTSTGFTLPTTSIYNVSATKYFYMAFRDVL